MKKETDRPRVSGREIQKEREREGGGGGEEEREKG